MRLSSNASATTNCGAPETAGSRDLLNLAFGYGTSNNNGNVLDQTIAALKQPGGTPDEYLKQRQVYTSDGVNRLATVNETVIAGATGGAWGQGFSYDQFGNMWVSGNTGLSLHVTTPTQQSQFNTSTNRLTGTGVTYDAVGNLTAYPLLGTMGYDAENRQTQFTSGSTTVTYHYDGDGRRVKRVKGSETTVFVYDAFGNLAADYSTAQATGTAGRYYRTTDHLGSTRLVTNDAAAVVSRHDFMPFGEELPASSSAGNRNLVFGFGAPSPARQKFTGKERDLDSNLDYFLARYYSSPMGRFTSADPENAGADRGDPQTWNGFAYVNNRPLTLTDPDGRCPNCAAGLAGFGVGFLVSAATETYRQVNGGGRLDGNRILAKGVQGGFVGAAIGATAGLALPTVVGTTAVAGAAGGIVERSIDSDPATQPVTAGDLTADAVSAGTAALAPALVGKVVGNLPSVQGARQAAEQAGKVAHETTASVFPSLAPAAAAEASKQSAAVVTAIDSVVKPVVSGPVKSLVNDAMDRLRKRQEEKNAP